MQPKAQGYSVTTQTVSYPGNGGTADGFLARPDDGGAQHPGLILVQEWWGIDSHIKDLAQQIADEGYIVLAPDLYHGKVVTEPDEAKKSMMALNMPAAVKEIGQALSYLSGRDDVEPKAVAMIGFCMGGRLAWKAAEQFGGQVACVAPFYGYNPDAGAVKISVPILAVFGEDDPSTPKAVIENVQNIIDQQGNGNSKLLVYPNAGHAFMNPEHGMGNPAAAADAFAELIAFLKKNVG